MFDILDLVTPWGWSIEMSRSLTTHRHSNLQPPAAVCRFISFQDQTAEGDSIEPQYFTLAWVTPATSPFSFTPRKPLVTSTPGSEATSKRVGERFLDYISRYPGTFR